MTTQNITPLAYAPDDVAQLIGIGRTKVFELIKKGDLQSCKIGSRRLVTHDAIVAYFTRIGGEV